MATYIVLLFCHLFFPYEGSTSSLIHPLHVSVVEINYDIPEKTLEITARIFTDDFEKVLGKKFGKKADFYSTTYTEQMAAMVKAYIPEHLTVWLDKKPIKYIYLGHEIIGEAVFVYFQAENTPLFSTLELKNSLLYDLFDDQSSINHVIVAGKRHSNKIVGPETTASFKFEKSGIIK